MKSGRCIYISPPFKGSNNDQNIWNATGLRERFIGKRYGIIGDMMFSFNFTLDLMLIHGFTPKKKKSWSEEIWSKWPHEKPPYQLSSCTNWALFQPLQELESLQRYSPSCRIWSRPYDIDFFCCEKVVASLIEWKSGLKASILLLNDHKTAQSVVWFYLTVNLYFLIFFKKN